MISLYVVTVTLRKAMSHWHETVVSIMSQN
jgi:hypothetical protein